MRRHPMGRHAVPRARQAGVAVITALLLTTLAVTIVASLFWQQQVQVRSMENQRLHLQTKWIMRGALDWARLILQQDARSNPTVTSENGPWATPLAETRLDDYVERERVANEKFDATLSGRVTDAQARYNLANLVQRGAPDPVQVQIFRRLLQRLSLNPGLAQTLAEELALSQPVAADAGGAGGTGGTGGTGGAGGGGGAGGAGGGLAGSSNGTRREPLELIRVEDLLAVSGFTQPMIEKLREFVVVLLPGVNVNVNTAPAEVLAALADCSVSEAATIVQFRRRTAFNTAADFGNYLAGQTRKTLPAEVKVEVKSDYFLVLSHVRLDRAALDAQSLIYRGPKSPVLLWMREI
ncbi:type II secretion system minor pseudopilin GspK [Massilia sp. Root351]|jgi:general secretion pathway protein K|uniref:type II secretion system minor pseudopilin GspK n=1 Tax=Massilia sp. Root351 TaxID=1736522 RepID=UPI000AD73EC8|nr:type II secretion system minor pseudopilin GspK [Massilia sp. Root351]